MLTCSDDGTVILYDISPMSKPIQTSEPDLHNFGFKDHAVMTQVDGFISKTHEQSKEEHQVRKSTRTLNKNQGHETKSKKENVERRRMIGEEIFSIQLTPNDFRPGQRNKKLDALAINNNGLVVAGSNTGEVFVWKVYFNEIQKTQPNIAECSKFIGQFKIHKSAGVQFCEISPNSELLMTGSTNGIVKLWKIGDVPLSKKYDSHQLKDFSFDNQSRLEL